MSIRLECERFRVRPL